MTIGPNSIPAMPSGHRMRRDLPSVSSTYRRTRRSLEDMAPPSPSSDPPLLRVKRLDEEDEEKKPVPPVAGLQRMKRIDEELNHGSRRRRRRAILTYDPELLINQIVEYIRE